MIDANFDWTAWAIMLGGSAVSIYAHLASNRRWVGIVASFVVALAVEVFDSALMKAKPFEVESVVVFGILFLIIGSAGASQWRRSSNRPHA